MQNTVKMQTPCYIIDEALLEQNLQILADVQRRTGCRILLAQKAFACYATYPLLSRYLAGTTASGLFEARLAAEEFPAGEIHVFAPAFKPEEFTELLRYADHISFNSLAQLQRFGPAAKAAGKDLSLRVNPEFSTQAHAIYDPCAPGSRLGVRQADFANIPAESLALLDGLHMHTLCEQNSDDLIRTVAALEEKFGEYLPQMRWLNLGGGHHITRPDYDIAALEHCLIRLRDKYGLQIYLEPGEAVALNCGFLQTTVLDIVQADMPVAILDASAACHMPDVLEMPYRPPLRNGFHPGEKPYTYRLSSVTCLAGDVIGDYSFETPVKVGDRLVFEDMAIYSMVKNNTFNGIPLPDICLLERNGKLRKVKTFSYADFKSRLS